MHADAVPDADRATLADPAGVAARITSLIQSAASAPAGARLRAA